jgi:NADH:ubiquinone oxidoreductase subunit E
MKLNTVKVDTGKIDRLVRKNGMGRDSLIPILQDIQREFNWLPMEALEIVSKELDIPLMDVYGVATFYRTFSLKPRGKHIITVCLGTACHVRGGQRIADFLSREMGIVPGETTEDMKFTLETVNCLGACALGPIVVVNGEYHGQMTTSKAAVLLKGIRKSDGRG